MMRDESLYLEAARHIASSADPAASLVRVMQIQSEVSRVRRLRWAVAVAAVILVAVGAWALRAHQGGGRATVTADALAEARWALDLLHRKPTEQLLERDRVRLVHGLDSDSSRVRRASLLALSHFGEGIPVEQLERVASGLAETIDLPVEVASQDGSDVRDALLVSRVATMRVVSRAIWFHAARHHTYPQLETIERFAMSTDHEVREAAYRALGEIPQYRASAEMRVRLEKDMERVRKAARKLLRRE